MISRAHGAPFGHADPLHDAAALSGQAHIMQGLGLPRQDQNVAHGDGLDLLGQDIDHVSRPGRFRSIGNRRLRRPIGAPGRKNAQTKDKTQNQILSPNHIH